MKRLLAACLAAIAGAVLAPARASADYLYSLWKDNEHLKPAVIVILDTSGSMDATDDCAYGYVDANRNGRRDKSERCYQRIEAAQQVLERTLPRIASDVDLGLLTFRHKRDGGLLPDLSRSRFKSTKDDGYNYCGVATVAAPPADFEDLIDRVLETEAETNTPLEWSLARAHEEIKTLRTKDGGQTCRDYYVILLTDGEDTCAKKEPDDVVKQVKTMFADGVHTFIIGFGKDLTDTNGTSNMSTYARAGGTATLGGEYVCWDDNTCGGKSKARAMFAYDTDELDAAILRSFEAVRRGVFSAAEPIIATVPTRDSEIERVARNVMVYSAFEMQGDNLRGHLYGIRLFEETAPYSGKWQFTNMDATDLLTNCGENKTCYFDAGAMLAARVADPNGEPRRILTGDPGSPDRTNGAYTVPMRRMVDLPRTDAAAGDLKSVWNTFTDTTEMRLALTDEHLPQRMPPTLPKASLRAPSTSLLRKTIDWLHGVGRSWPLGDMYHGSAVVVEPPAFNFIDRGYPVYKQHRSTRPWMVYGGANDGMIHAFYASPDFDWKREGASGPRWHPGDEAWAYLPNNLIARTVYEVERKSERFFSMDLSCRYADVIVDDPMRTVNGKQVVQCPTGDPDCGWATVLLCGQGWGGSWYVALDVSDPENPVPMWEATIPGPEGVKDGDAYGLGRTWSVPSVALVNLDGKPNWLAVFGNGYNADMANCPAWKSASSKCETAGGVTYQRHASYRMLNLPFDGQYPEHGDGTDGDNGHTWVMNLTNGQVLQPFHMHKSINGGGGKGTAPVGKQASAGDPGALIADVASVDTDNNAFMDAAYVGGWDGSLYRVYFGDKKTAGTSAIGMCEKDLLHFGTSKRITSNPAVVRNPGVTDGVHLFIGTGVDGGSDPDQQRNSGSQWEFGAFSFADDGSDSCDNVKTTGLCKNDDWKLSNRARLVGQPLFSRQIDGHDWLLYTTWTPPTNACGASGVAQLWCLDVTNPAACTNCGSLDGDTKPERSVIIDTGGVPPTSPVVADGNVYVGPKRKPILTGPDGTEAPQPNTRKSRVITISWREVF